MTSLVSMQMLLFAGEAFAASSLIMALAWIAAARKTASQRHLVWVSAFGALIALPALAAVVPAQIRLSLAAPVIPVTQGFDASVASLPEPSGFSIDASTVAYALLALWLIGVAAIAARGMIAAFALHGLRRRSAAHRFGHLPIAGPRCELRLAPEDCGPMTWGIFRPVILLPEGAESWPRVRLEAVLLHELAHIRRHDALTQFLALAVCAVYWPNPLIWLAAARLRREAETAADDAVLAAGVKPSAYAGELLQIASEFRVQRLSLPLAMAAPSALEARVKSVLEPNKSRSGVTTMDVFKIACLGMMATTAIAFARPSLAQDAPQAQSAPLPQSASQAAAPDSRVVRETDAPGSKIIRETDTYNRNDSGSGDSYVIDSNDNGHRHVVRRWSELSPQERARIHTQVRAAMAKAKPDIERAMRQVEAARPQIETAMREVEMARPQIEAAMAEAERSVDGAKKVEIEHAMEKARLALAKVPNEAELNAQINRAMAKAHLQMEAMRVHMHDHGGDMVAPEPPDAPDAPDADDEAPEAPAAPPAPPAPPAAPAAPQN
jgi:beta-lactamase regulating signal transducer with metallopeptidase domain